MNTDEEAIFGSLIEARNSKIVMMDIKTTIAYLNYHGPIHLERSYRGFSP